MPFKTYSTPLAATCIHEGFRVTGIERSADSGRVTFVFEDSEGLQEAVQGFWSGDLVCPARSLLMSYKEAKGLVFDCHQ